MKTLTIFRHAKSSWKLPLSDRDRPLNQRGYRQARAMAEVLALEPPDVIVSSPAIRAVSTALIYLQVWKIPASKLSVNDNLYVLSAVQVSNWIREFDDDTEKVWLFGHNPTCNNLAAILLGYELDNIVTSGYLSVQFGVDRWSLISKQHVKLVTFNNREGIE